MEYQNKVLMKLGENPNFNFHSKCEKLQLIKLCFADDLLKFTRGDIGFINLVMQAFNNFSESTGLNANPSKCKTYLGNVEDRVKNEILEVTSFVEGPLPFKYLGMPLTSRNLSINNCVGLVDKLVHRIRHWSSRLLNFIGRTQLIKNVLFAISNFWIQCFPIPKQVI